MGLLLSISATPGVGATGLGTGSIAVVAALVFLLADFQITDVSDGPIAIKRILIASIYPLAVAFVASVTYKAF